MVILFVIFVNVVVEYVLYDGGYLCVVIKIDMLLMDVL